MWQIIRCIRNLINLTVIPTLLVSYVKDTSLSCRARSLISMIELISGNFGIAMYVCKIIPKQSSHCFVEFRYLYLSAWWFCIYGVGSFSNSFSTVFPKPGLFLVFEKGLGHVPSALIFT